MYFYYEAKTASYEAQHGVRLSPTPHLHNHIEIVLIKKGQTLAIADSAEVTVDAGDLFIAFPNQVHYYLDKIYPLDYSIVIFSPDMCPEFNRVLKSLIPKKPLIKNALDNPQIISAINTIVRCKQSREEYTETEARGSVLVLMSELLRSVEFIEKVKYDNNLVKEILIYCYENYSADISLQSISEALHVSRCHVSRIFNKRLHISLIDYINSLRIRTACEMLKTNESTITEIAYAVGYNSVRTFNRCFVNIRGMTPNSKKLPI